MGTLENAISQMAGENNTRGDMLYGMEQIIRSINDESYIMTWLSLGVPDGSSKEDIYEMAQDEETFKYCFSVFLNIMSRVADKPSSMVIGKETIDKDWYKSH